MTGPSAFIFQCRTCGSILEATTPQSSRPGQCPTCGSVFAVPELDPRTGLPLDPGTVVAEAKEGGGLHAYAAAGHNAPTIVRGDGETAGIQCPRCEHVAAIELDRCPLCGLPFTLEGGPGAASAGVDLRAKACLALGITAVLTIWCWVGAVAAVAGLALGLLAWTGGGGGSGRKRRTLVVLGMLAAAAALAVGLVLWMGRRF